MKKTLAVILALLILSFSVLTFSAENGGINGSNWQSAVDGSLPITAINMPGTHDSAARYLYFSTRARTQSLSVLQQLYAGVRYLDVRLALSGNSILAMHGVLNCKKELGLFAQNLTAKDIVSDCKKFLEQNPGETILFLLKQEESEKSEKLFTRFYDELIAPSPELWYTKNKIPVLDEVRGKIVLLRVAEADKSRFGNSNSGINFETYPYIGSTDMNDFRFKKIISLDKRLLSEPVGYMFVQDSYKIEGEKKTKVIANFFADNLSENHFNICCTNANNKNTPYANAKKVNAFLSSYDFKAGGVYGIVAMDFATAELCERIYMTNLPNMTNTPNTANSVGYGESFGFLGELIFKLNSLFLKLSF